VAEWGGDSRVTIFYKPKESAYFAKAASTGSCDCLLVTGEKNFLGEPMIFFYGN
jgi:hypothetical protein